MNKHKLYQVRGYDHTVYLNDNLLDPKPSQRVINHSPDGFSWGYGGSGPAQLALAIMLKFVKKDIAVLLYQDFKWQFVARWENPGFSATIDIIGWIEKQKAYKKYIDSLSK